MNKYLKNIQDILYAYKNSFIPIARQREIIDSYIEFKNTLSEGEKKLLEDIILDHDRYYRNWLYDQKDLDQILLKQKMFEMLVDVFSNNLKSMEESKFYPQYQRVKDRILEDMDKNLYKYLRDPYGSAP